MAWIPAAIIGGSSIVGGLLGGGSSGGGGGGSYSGVSGAYTPQGLQTADTAWQQAFGNEQGVANQVGSTVQPLYQQSLNAQQGIDYSQYLQGAQQAGQAYTGLAGLAGQQANMYGGAAQTAQGQQQNLYGNANQVAQTAFDPQNALYDRTQQQLSDQVNAGQAMRGLGVSPVGGSEYNQAMSNFNIDWQNQQLARQTQGIQAQAAGSQAGAQQGTLAGADLAAQLSAQGQVPSYLQQAGQVPTTAQQYVAGMPATNAASYQTNMGQLANLYGGVQNQAIPYMNAGVGAQQTQQQFNAQQQAAGAAAGAQMGGMLGNVAAQYYNQPINSANLWSGSSGGGNFTPTTGNSFNVNYLGGASSPSGQYSTDYITP
jgi:hypothetical protein